MTKTSTGLVLTALVAAGVTACSTYRESEGNPSDDSYFVSRSDSTIRRFESGDPSIRKFLNESYAYAVFPEVTKGAAGIGAAHGKGGVVYEHGGHVGFAELAQITVGAQLGGQSFSEIVFFQNATAFSDFKIGRTKFSGNASAVLAKSGSAAAADYREGVAVFVMPTSGAMFEASIGGQEFKYRAK